MERSDKVFRYNSDGTGTQSHHFRVKVQNDAGVHDFSVISTPFASDTQKAHVESLTVTHSDGTVTVTPASDTMTLPAQVTQQAPLYSDLEVTQTPVRGLRPGDTLDYQITITQTKPEAPNQFWDGANFLKDAVVKSQTVTLDVPDGKHVQVSSPRHQAALSRHDGRVVYYWTYNQLKPTASHDKKSAAPEESKPDILWTTFASWKQLGDWYGGLAAPEASPTDSVRAEANLLTQNAKTPEDQVKAIYTFVATRIRYVGIDFGIGRLKPHSAAMVLANQYGDCKDKDTLLEALLRAKGFTTAPALVGVGIASIPDLPTPLQFNHVITTVQMASGQIWLDSTPAVAPFQLLTAPVRDKEALVIPDPGVPKLEKTPAAPPYPFENHFLAEGVLSADGGMQAHITITDRSDAELILRAIAMSVPPAQWDDGTQYIARIYGFGGKTSKSEFGRADDFTAPMKVTYDYTRKPYGDWDNYRILPLFPAIGLPAAPEEAPENALKLGAPRTDTAITKIKLPPGFRADLPDPIHVNTPFATFDQTYEVVDQTLTVRRTVVVRQSKLPVADWQQYQKFTKDVSLNNLPYIQLHRPGTAQTESNAAAHGNPAAAELIQEAWRLENANDYADAKKRLDEARTIRIDQPYLWSSYGYVAYKAGNLKLADKDYRREISEHPDETFAVSFDAWLLHSLHKDGEAESLLQSALKRFPGDPRLVFRMTGLQADGNVPAAIATLRTAVAAAPDNFNFKLALASFLRRQGSSKEAVSMLERVLDAAHDPGLLNDASYELALTGADLSLAEQKSQQSVDMLTAESNNDIAAADQKAFRQAQSLIANWDTLGYIFLSEKKLDAAQKYLQASWTNRPNVTDGLHYGELLQQLGHKREALRTYQISSTDSSGPNSNEDQPLLRDAIQRLKAQQPNAPVVDSAKEVQKLRTFEVPIHPAAPQYRVGIFRLQLQSSGVHNVLRVGGDASLDSATNAIRKLPLEHYVPTGSSAYLLRDAAVTCPARQTSCQFVLMPVGDISAEKVQK